MIARAPRGQAITETVLGLLVFVTVLMFGIHFAEVGYLSVKAQEAAASALWDATGERVQNIYPSNQTPFANLLLNVPAQENDRYRDFDGLRSTQAGAATTSQVITRGSNMQVSCDDRSAQIGFSPTPLASSVYRQVGGMSCTASAQLTAPGMPQHFLDESTTGGIFTVEHYPLIAPMTVCGVGRAVGGACNGRYGIMLNDWGFAGDRGGENLDCPRGRTNCPNPKYRDAVNTMWVGGGGAGAAFAINHAGSAPVSANDYWFSFAGVERNYLNGSGPGESFGVYNTGGPGGGATFIPPRTSASCFLGMPERGTLVPPCG